MYCKVRCSAAQFHWLPSEGIDGHRCLCQLNINYVQIFYETVLVAVLESARIVVLLFVIIFFKITRFAKLNSLWNMVTSYHVVYIIANEVRNYVSDIQ